MLEHKGLAATPDTVAAVGEPLGEAFEIAAFEGDVEAERYPSRLAFRDGSELELAELLKVHAPALLGEAFIERYGARVPLLPKTLDIKELLSVQGHPPGNTEVYVIIAADPGATIRLGFKQDIDASRMRQTLRSGQRQQAEFAELLAPGTDLDNLHRLVAPWFARRDAVAAAIETPIVACLAAPANWSRAAALLTTLKVLYWQVLDALNTIPVRSGQIIHNATPPRLLNGSGQLASAEVHALGNPEGKAILALEIRRPGPTFRAWDNVRFPIREIDIDAALGALNLTATTADEFLVEAVPIPRRPGAFGSIDTPSMRIEHLRPSAEYPVAVPAESPHCLHVIRGGAIFRTPADETVGQLGRGESALVPVGVGAYLVSALESPTEIVKVSLPLR